MLDKVLTCLSFTPMPNSEPSRRQFLAFLAGSPLLAAAGFDADALEHLAHATTRGSDQALRLAQRVVEHGASAEGVIQSAKDALSVFDFEPVAKQNIPVSHWGYLATGTDDDGTILANREGFDRWALHPRRLINVSNVDASVSLSTARAIQRRSSSIPSAVKRPFTHSAKSPLLAPRRPAIICRCCPPSRRHLSKTPSPRAAGRFGFNSIINPTGRSRDKSFSVRRTRVHRRWSSPSISSAVAIVRR